MERKLSQGGKASLAVARALYTIKIKRLFRDRDQSMKAYGKRWGYSPAYTCRLIQSGEIYDHLEPFCLAESLPLPKSEWQLRPLARLSPVDQRLVWKSVISGSSGKRLSAETIEQEVNKLQGKPKSKSQFRRPQTLTLDLSRFQNLHAALREAARAKKISVELYALQVLRAQVSCDFTVPSGEALDDLLLCNLIRS